MAFKDDQVEAGEDVSKLTLTYEAATALKGVTLTIVVSGIQLEPDEDDAATRDPAIGGHCSRVTMTDTVTLRVLI